MGASKSHMRTLSPASRVLWLTILALTVGSSSTALAAAPMPGPALGITRLTAPIAIDGDLSDAGWKGVAPITQWFETNPGDNVEPRVKNLAWLAYDEHYLYAGFQFEDPHPELIRAPIGDHDNTPSSTDYAGLLIDSRGDGKSARMFLANPSGVEYDAITNDATGEDSSPDFFWDAVGKITATGWNLEVRIPFSSLRYSSGDSSGWGLLLYRNHPRDRRYQYFSARLPRGGNCLVCNESRLTGLVNLPHGSHLVVAPYATAERQDAPKGDLGSPLAAGDPKSEAGVDVKWSPFADLAIDGTVNPDFSQVESDAAQIGTNERFALFYPEKRTFFLEGVDMFTLPFQAVYTRTITSPSAGVRATGHTGTTAFTGLYTHDQGGGLVILPGPEGSGFAPQDFSSDVGIMRLRTDLGASFVSVLGTTRELEGGGHNRVFGPDFQWRPRAGDTFLGQYLVSDSRTPNRPDLASEWDGRSFTDHAVMLNGSHNGRQLDVFFQGMELGERFRADDGFIPQVGYRELYHEAGWTVRPKKSFFSRVRLWEAQYWDTRPSGQLLTRHLSAGFGFDGKMNSQGRAEFNHDDILVGGQVLHRFRPRLYFQSSPGSIVNLWSIDAYVGQEIDFDNAREGTGTTLIGLLMLRPNKHLELRNDASARWLNVEAESGHSGRLFLTQVERLRATWSFNARTFVRGIGQYQVTSRDASLYTFGVNPKSAHFDASALFAYKLNWQTVLYAGYGDNRTWSDLSGRLEHSGRQAFAKISYALQQ